MKTAEIGFHANFQLRSFFYEKTPVKHYYSGIRAA